MLLDLPIDESEIGLKIIKPVGAKLWALLGLNLSFV